MNAAEVGNCNFPIYREWDAFSSFVDGGAILFEFRLVYQGSLTSSGNTAQPEVKHHIRLYLHEQMVNIWKTRQPLSDTYADKGRLDDIAYTCSRNLKHRFLPIIRTPMYCSLDVLLLRRDLGHIMVSGDLDGRIKTLIDALALPNVTENIDTKDEQPNPIYCLMQDDSLISEIHVTADHLFASQEQVIESPRITPQGNFAESTNHVFAVIHVKIGIPEMTMQLDMNDLVRRIR